MSIVSLSYARKGGERRVFYLISPLTRHGNHKTSLETKIGDSSASTRNKISHFFTFLLNRCPHFLLREGSPHLFIAIRSPDADSSSASSVPSIPALYGAMLGRPWKMLSVTEKIAWFRSSPLCSASRQPVGQTAKEM